MPGDMEDEDEEEDDDMGLNQPKLVGGLLGWLRNWGEGRLAAQPDVGALATETLLAPNAWSE